MSKNQCSTIKGRRYYAKEKSSKTCENMKLLVSYYKFFYFSILFNIINVKGVTHGLGPMFASKR